MIRCRRCLIPNTRPDTAFQNGYCSACVAYEQRPRIDWEERHRSLEQLLDRHHGECIVPSSGGKDSHYQVLRLQELGASVTVVTASTCHLTPIGRKNIENLKRYARTIEYSPNAAVRAKLNRLGLFRVGDISWPEHVAIFTTPFRAARDLRIPLVFYGENPQNQYGGPMDALGAQTMTRRWVSEFGGFNGLRPDDCVGYDGITERDMADYRMPAQEDLAAAEVEAHFLGWYEPWDSHRNAAVAAKHGMRQATPSIANWWSHENLDNAQTGIHDHLMFRKYGYGRLCAQLSVDLRCGWVVADTRDPHPIAVQVLDREGALALVRERDGRFPFLYAGVSVDEVLERIGITMPELSTVLDRFTNFGLFHDRQVDAAHLKEE